MSTRDSYSHGQTLGYAYADADEEASLPLGSSADELRAEATEAREDSPSWRAFKLGIVRAYRDATRSQVSGRWGS